MPNCDACPRFFPLKLLVMLPNVDHPLGTYVGRVLTHPQIGRPLVGIAALPDVASCAPDRSARPARVDRAISWILTTFAAVALAWLGSEVRTMNLKIEALTVKIAVVEAAKYGEEIKRLEERVRVLENNWRNKP